ncbi:serine hydrolase [Portibacter lacus]|uniref:Serine hydrolase n=1 Tax=Portibacter lacus TaxID=1099794 RepID=A0AA37STJ8_9BACT|nr:serine hydrolase [Portibacter lacus]GLR19972.1 serine hydrolase [Portibacter lacus]
MKLISYLILTSTLVVLASVSSKAQQGQYKEIENYIEEARKSWEIPGLAVALIKDGEVVYKNGFGVKELNKPGRVDENTVFSVASNTKAFTSMAVGILVQQGKLSWDDPVIKHLPDFQMYDPQVTRKVTIRDFLSHKSGLGLWAGDLTWWDSNYDKAEVIRRIRFQKPVADLHEKYIYCNLGYLVVGEVIAKVSGMTYEKFIETQFFDPLGMTRSLMSVSGLPNMENVAVPHSGVNGELVPIAQLNVDNCAPAASVVTSVNDLTHWVQMQLANGTYKSHKILEESIIEETRKPHSIINVSKWSKENLNPYTNFSSYALGWRVFDFRGEYLVEHTGGLDGMLSYVGFIPEENIGVILVTNSDQHDIQNCLPKYLFDRLLGVEENMDWSGKYLKINKANKARRAEEAAKAKASIPVTTPTLALNDYCGEYTSDVYGTAKVYMEDGKLKVSLSAHPGFIGDISHLYYNTFTAKWNHRLWKESNMYFDFNGHGQIINFKMAVRPDWIDTLEYTFKKN